MRKIFIIFYIISLCQGFILPSKIKHCGIEHCDIDNLDACCDICLNCNNTGLVRCEFCKATGFLTINNDLIGTNNKCVVCDGSGERICKTCMGAGKIARWRYKLKK